jgi:hypothetical protein
VTFRDGIGGAKRHPLEPRFVLLKHELQKTTRPNVLVRRSSGDLLALLHGPDALDKTVARSHSPLDARQHSFTSLLPVFALPYQKRAPNSPRKDEDRPRHEIIEVRHRRGFSRERRQLAAPVDRPRKPALRPSTRPRPNAVDILITPPHARANGVFPFRFIAGPSYREGCHGFRYLMRSSV